MMGVIRAHKSASELSFKSPRRGGLKMYACEDGDDDYSDCSDEGAHQRGSRRTELRPAASRPLLLEAVPPSNRWNSCRLLLDMAQPDERIRPFKRRGRRRPQAEEPHASTIKANPFEESPIKGSISVGDFLAHQPENDDDDDDDDDQRSEGGKETPVTLARRTHERGWRKERNGGECRTGAAIGKCNATRQLQQQQQQQQRRQRRVKSACSFNSLATLTQLDSTAAAAAAAAVGQRQRVFAEPKTAATAATEGGNATASSRRTDEENDADVAGAVAVVVDIATIQGQDRQPDNAATTTATALDAAAAAATPANSHNGGPHNAAASRLAVAADSSTEQRQQQQHRPNWLDGKGCRLCSSGLELLEGDTGATGQQERRRWRQQQQRQQLLPLAAGNSQQQQRQPATVCSHLSGGGDDGEPFDFKTSDAKVEVGVGVGEKEKEKEKEIGKEVETETAAGMVDLNGGQLRLDVAAAAAAAAVAGPPPFFAHCSSWNLLNLRHHHSSTYKVAQRQQQAAISGIQQPELSGTGGTGGNGTGSSIGDSSQRKVLHYSRPGRSPISLQRQTNARLIKHRQRIQQQRQEQLLTAAKRQQQQHHQADGTSERFRHQEQQQQQRRERETHQEAARELMNLGAARLLPRAEAGASGLQDAITIEIGDIEQPGCSGSQQQARRQKHHHHHHHLHNYRARRAASAATQRGPHLANVIVYNRMPEDQQQQQPDHLTSASGRYTRGEPVDDVFALEGRLATADDEEVKTICSTSDSSSTLSLNRPFCKICHLGNSKNGDKLISPCRCSGTMQYIHCGCLLKWLEISNKTNEKPMSCELCAHEYTWHKRFNVRQLRLPKCSPRDAVLHTIFVLALVAMVGSAFAPILFKRAGAGDQLAASSPVATSAKPDTTIASSAAAASADRSPTSLRRQHYASTFASSASGSQHAMASAGRLASEEKFMLLCAASFFVSFFLAIYAQTKARDTLYGLVVKFLTMNQTYYITEYDHGQNNNNNNSNPSSSKQQQQQQQLYTDQEPPDHLRANNRKSLASK